MACRKENGNQILLKMSLAEPKDSKDENFEDLKLLKKETKFGITKWSREELFSKPKRIGEEETDTWLLSCMPKVAMQNRSCLRKENGPGVQMNRPLIHSIKHATAGDQLVGWDEPLMSNEEFQLEFTSLNIPFEFRLLNSGTRLEMMDL